MQIKTKMMILSFLLVGQAQACEERALSKSYQLIEASKCGHTAKIELLLKSGADINATDIYEHTSLKWAIIEKQTEAFDLLLEKGADINQKDRIRRNALYWAQVYERHDMIAKLRAKGAL